MAIAVLRASDDPAPLNNGNSRGIDADEEF
jgi:hypothetical protein